MPMHRDWSSDWPPASAKCPARWRWTFTGPLPNKFGHAINPKEFRSLLNLDGVARGHWRANWGRFNRDGASSNEHARLAIIAGCPSVKPALMLDFHSTDRNLFVCGEEASAQKRFRGLAGRQENACGLAFSIERRVQSRFGNVQELVQCSLRNSGLYV
jgi:hypothetical protein